MSIEERTTVFGCGTDQLLGIISCPKRPLHRGVLIVVGGPQYRAGSHRQFTLLCRALAELGIAAMRFDCRGMGDSQGDARNFEGIRPDIDAAIGQFCIKVPELSEIVIWGLCDAASAALMCAYRDTRISGLVMLNPWVRTAEGYAKTQLKHYYWSRIKDREFWRKLATGKFAYAAAVRSFADALMRASGIGRAHDAVANSAVTPGEVEAKATTSLPERMAEGLSKFKGKVLIILSGSDLTAQEFEDVAQRSMRWTRLLADPRIEHRRLLDANHTFSTRAWRDQVTVWTADWVQSW